MRKNGQDTRLKSRGFRTKVLTNDAWSLNMTRGSTTTVGGIEGGLTEGTCLRQRWAEVACCTAVRHGNERLAQNLALG